MNPEEKNLPEETVDEQAADNSVFGAVQKYNADYNEILDQQDEYLVSRLNQQNAKAGQAYTQEKSAAYADYQKQVDPYGVQAEQMAQSGLTGSGYAESLKTQAYVAYQNRQAVAYQSYQDALVSFNNAFTEAKMQNDATRANLAFQTHQMQLEAIVSMITNGQSSVVETAGNLMQYAQNDPERWKDVLSYLGKLEGKNLDDDVVMSAATGVRNYDDAVSVLTQYGSTEKPLSRADWRKDKMGYKSYRDYLEAFVVKSLG